ncbi:MAG: large conductance mechanosensitive channel protein MscL [Micrococcales bacterium]|nr:large conductance mechanosensitive channel protein MscL [Micrococcales bacterium]
MSGATSTPSPTPTEPAPERLSGVTKVLSGFKDFISRGNAVELAVGVVIGAAFGAVVTSLQNNLIGPLIGWIFGKPDLANLWSIGPYSWQHSTADNPISPIKVGAILNSLLAFLITAAAIYFLIVLPLNALAKHRAKAAAEPEPEPAPEEPPEDIALLRDIRDLLADRATPTSPGIRR